MKRKLMTGLICGALLSVPAVALADATGADYSSNGVVVFETSDEETLPNDPLIPGKPVLPIDPTTPEGKPNPGTPGPLSIDFASSLDFGKQKVISKDQEYYAKAQHYIDEDGVEQTGPNYVQVTDNRGTESGWTLKLKQEEQFKTAEAEELVGASIQFLNGNVVTDSNSPAPTGRNEFTLVPGEEQVIMAAKNAEGAGTYLHDWGTDVPTGGTSIKLLVPGSSTKYAKQYTTQFSWVLSDVVDNG